jgi:hypothetical protein
MTFTVTYDASIPATKNVNKIGLRMTSSENKDRIFELSTYPETIFDPVHIEREGYKLNRSQSIYKIPEYLKMSKELFDIRSVTYKGTTRQSTSTMRNIVLTKNIKGDDTVINDGFSATLLLNGEVDMAIEDKTIMNMLISLMYVSVDNNNGHNVFKGDVERMLKYIFSVIKDYAENQMYVHDKVKISSIEVDIQIDRLVNDNKKLHDMLIGKLSCGEIVPVSLYHYMFIDRIMRNETIPNRWKNLMTIYDISAPEINKYVSKYIPKMDVMSKDNLSQYYMKRDRLSNKYYNPDAMLPFQLEYECSLSIDQLFKEMYMRNLNIDDYPEQYPVITKGRWVAAEATSFHVNKTYHSKLAKVSVEGLDGITDDLFKAIGLRGKHEFRPPYYVRRLTGLSRTLPSWMRRVVYE